MLEVLGLSAREEQVYRLVVDGYRSEAGEIAAKLGATVSETQPVLRTLVRKRLVSRSGDHYVAAAPDVALGSLLLQGQREIEQARAEVGRLTERHRSSARRHEPARLVEVVTGAEAIRQQALSLQRGAREEMLWFCREAPIAMAASENDEEFRALERGVRYRVLYENALLEEPGALAGIAEGIRAGEEARSVPQLPVRLAVADRSTALCPLDADEVTGEPTAALVRNSTLLGVFVALFEGYWERGTPMQADVSSPRGPLDTAERTVLALLISGVSDKSIAKQLQVSHRTVQRRVQQLMHRARAQSRTQLAWRAAKLGWLD